MQFKAIMHIIKSPDDEIVNGAHSFVLTKIEVIIWVIVLPLYTIIFIFYFIKKI